MVAAARAGAVVPVGSSAGGGVWYLPGCRAAVMGGSYHGGRVRSLIIGGGWSGMPAAVMGGTHGGRGIYAAPDGGGVRSPPP